MFLPYIKNPLFGNRGLQLVLVNKLKTQKIFNLMMFGKDTISCTIKTGNIT